MKKNNNKQRFTGIPEGVERQRLSKAYMLVSFIKGIKSAAIPVIIIIAGSVFGSKRENNNEIFSFGDFHVNEFHLVAFLLLIGLVVAFISMLIQYFNTFWCLTDSEVILAKGLLNKKITRMPFEKIHSINTNESIMERAFDVVSVKIDSAGGASGDIVIPCIKNNVAENLRAEITRQMKLHQDGLMSTNQSSADTSVGAIDKSFIQTGDNASPIENQPQMQPETSNNDNSIHSPAFINKGYVTEDAREYRLKIKEILLAGLANGRSMLYLIIGLGAVFQIVENSGLFDYVFSRVSAFGKFLFEQGVLAIIILLLLLVLVAWIISVVSFAIKFYGFSIRTEGDRIETNRGLISRIHTQIGINRIQEIQVSQTVLARVFRYATIKAEIATNVSSIDGSDNNGMGTTGVILHPFIKRKDVDGFIAAFIPEYNSRPEKTEPLPLAACRRSFFRYARWTILFLVIPIIAVFIFLPDELASFVPLIKTILLIAGIVGFVFLMFTAWRSYKGKGLAIGERIMAVKSGAYSTKFSYIPKRKIQRAVMKQNPFQRASKVATIYMHTAASAITTKQVDVSESNASEYLVWASPETTLRKVRVRNDELFGQDNSGIS